MGMATGPCKWVEVDCPNCLNANRAARRHCDWCNRTGKVTKSIPVGPDVDTSTPRWMVGDVIPEVVHVGDYIVDVTP